MLSLVGQKFDWLRWSVSGEREMKTPTPFLRKWLIITNLWRESELKTILRHIKAIKGHLRSIEKAEGHFRWSTRRFFAKINDLSSKADSSLSPILTNHKRAAFSFPNSWIILNFLVFLNSVIEKYLTCSQFTFPESKINF